MANLAKNTASQNITFCMVTTAGAADASATVSVFVTKDNGSQASGGGTVTNSGNGQYNYAPTQAETNAVDVGFMFTATGDVPVNLDFHTDVVNASGFAEVDATYINGQTTSAAGTVTFPGTVASATNITGGTITTVTNLTNAPTAGDLTATMKASVTTAATAATPVASLSGDLTSTMKTSVQTASAAAITAYGTATATEVAAVTSALAGDISALNNLSQAQVASALATFAAAQPSESYAANTTVPTRDQFLFMIFALLNTFSFSGTAQKVTKLDNSTQAMGYTIDSATAPTEHTRTA